MAELAADDPREIGGYRLLSRLGSGGMGRVYLARSEGGRTVAVKLIKQDLAAEQEFRARFRLEVEAARRVGERWTAPVLDADTEADTPWVATGYIAGPTLDRVVSSRARAGIDPLPERSIRTLAYGLGSALLDIHGAGMVHRDLKPSNVLVTIDGPRVIDFGIARALDGVPDSAAATTHTGVMMGSPGFMSPEQVRSDPVSPASDVFSMGTVLAYAATGRPPFGSGSGSGGVHTVLYRLAQDEPDLDGLEGPLREMIRACMEKDPARRPAPEDVVAEVQPVSLCSASDPWLPATLVAELGRHAVQLLDKDTPPSGSRPPGALGPEAGAATGAGAGAADPTGGGSALASVTGASGKEATGKVGVRSRAVSGRRWALFGLAAVLVAAAGSFAVSSDDFPFSPASSSRDDAQAGDDVPSGFVGTWSGDVDRDGEPTGQYRRFVITEGERGEVVANSTSLGRDYECKSDAKLVSAGSGRSITLDTKVIKSVPKGRCSALGRHRLTRRSSTTLTWESAGRSATLHRVHTPERLPDGYTGTWQRPLPDGGTQRMRVRQPGPGVRAVTMISTGPSERCEADVDLYSASSPVRVAPPSVDKHASTGTCAVGDASTLRLEHGTLVRAFPGGQALTYQKVH